MAVQLRALERTIEYSQLFEFEFLNIVVRTTINLSYIYDS